MTGCKALLRNFLAKRNGFVSFGNNSKGYVQGSGDVSNGKITFNNVNLIENLKFNLLSV